MISPVQMNSSTERPAGNSMRALWFRSGRPKEPEACRFPGSADGRTARPASMTAPSAHRDESVFPNLPGDGLQSQTKTPDAPDDRPSGFGSTDRTPANTPSVCNSGTPVPRCCPGGRIVDPDCAEPADFHFPPAESAGRE